MIKVIATLTAKSGLRDEMLAEFSKVVAKVQAEDGCLEYDVWVDMPSHIATDQDGRPDTLVVVEKWESPEALEDHLIAKHMNEFRQATRHLLESITLEILEKP